MANSSHHNEYHSPAIDYSRRAQTFSIPPTKEAVMAYVTEGAKWDLPRTYAEFKVTGKDSSSETIDGLGKEQFGEETWQRAKEKMEEEVARMVEEAKVTLSH